MTCDTVPEVNSAFKLTEPPAVINWLMLRPTALTNPLASASGVPTHEVPSARVPDARMSIHIGRLNSGPLRCSGMSANSLPRGWNEMKL
ncbi:hypothetical protein ES707_06532 [subsurface metagenome]